LIARLHGKVVDKGVDHAIVDVGGVGYLVHASVGTLASLPLGDAATLRIHTHVREDALDLYGFADEVEELVFRELIATPNIGCKKAITILSGLPAEEIVDAIREGDAPRLARAHGVGKKTAERLVVELKDRLARFAPGAAGKAPKGTLVDDLVSGLTNLGYKADAATAAAEEVLAELGGNDLSTLLREALGRLRKR
jgi:Holliday junction DNA helicase RuvA